MKKDIGRGGRLTVTKALLHLSQNTYEGQRHYRIKWRKEIEEKIKAGVFHQGVIATLKLLDGKILLVDGQHTCGAVVSLEQGVRVMFHEYALEKGDPDDAIAALYAQYTGGHERSRGDVVYSFGVECGWKDWGKRCIGLCGTALAFLKAGCPPGCPTMNREEVGKMLAPNRKRCEAVHEILFGGAAEMHTRRSPVAAAVMITAEIDYDAACAFWGAVQSGEMLRKTDPRYKLREFLMHSTVRAGKWSATDVPKSSRDEREMYSACIRAWNDFRNGKKVNGNGHSYRYHSDRPVPVAA